MIDPLATTEITPNVGDLEGWLAQLGGDWAGDDDATLIDQISLLEKIKASAAAAQARLTVQFKESRVTDRKAAGKPARDLMKGIGPEIALARQQATSWGSRFVGFSDALVHEMPHTLAALSAGVISEYGATLLVAETACLTREDRTQVDLELAGQLVGMSTKQMAAEAKKIAYRLDPHAVVERSRKAEKDRRVTSWPAPDTMMNVCGLLPATQGAAVIGALNRAADTALAAGDERTKGQLMADTFVERLTGQAAADETPVEICLIINDETLFGDDHTPAVLSGHGPLPAAQARDLLRRLDDDTTIWIRRLFTDPCTGLISAIDAKRRLFTGALRRALIIRDQWCRTPWCGAPIRHSDHVIAFQDGGETSEPNGQGLCAACNYTKEVPGWTSRPAPGGAGESVTLTTPTGHSYVSRPPPLPGADPHQAYDELPDDPPYPPVTVLHWDDICRRAG